MRPAGVQVLSHERATRGNHTANRLRVNFFNKKQIILILSRKFVVLFTMLAVVFCNMPCKY